MSSLLNTRLKSPGPKRILALDGGGIRGILTLSMLESLESLLRIQHNNPKLLLSDYFDLIGGTSTGSIIASGLAIGLSVAEIKEKYLNLGKVIFGKKSGLFNYLSKGEKYNINPFSKALNEFFGDTKFGDQEKIKTGLCILTKRADTFSTWPFINHPDGKFYEYNKDIPLWHVVRASSAAPTYFLPMVLDIGSNEKGTFIDGGVSMANNPALTLFLVATLKGFPFHWSSGEDRILLVSMGTGKTDHQYHYNDLKQMNLLSWAGMIPEYLMSDANHYNQLVLQLLSNSPTAKVIDREIGDLNQDQLNGKYALHYLRYDVDFTVDYIHSLGLNYSAVELKKLSEMDDAKNIPQLSLLGELAGAAQIKASHLPQHFILNQNNSFPLRITPQDASGLLFQNVVKKNIPIQATQINQPFEVETLEGLMNGKPGDYLMKGVRGEFYICDQSIFNETYEKI